MDLFNFRKLVFDMAKADGQPYIEFSNVEGLNALIAEQLDVYCAKTGCLSSDAIAFTPKIDASSFDTRDTTYFARRIADVRHVFIEGSVMAQYGSPRGGESSEEEIVQNLARSLTADSGKPAYWWQENPNTLRFNCPFDQVYTNCFVAGTLYHSELLKDTQELDLAPEDIRPAARLIASELLFPLSRDNAATTRQFAETEIAQRENRTGRKLNGKSVRGGGDNTTYRLN